MTKTITPTPAATGVHEDVDRWLAEQSADAETERLAGDLRAAEADVAGVRRRPCRPDSGVDALRKRDSLGSARRLLGVDRAATVRDHVR